MGDYMKKVVKYLEDNGRSAEVDSFKNNINKVMKELLGKFKALQFFTGESMDAEAMILVVDYKEIDGEERPCLLAFKHGLEKRNAEFYQVKDAFTDVLNYPEATFVFN